MLLFAASLGTIQALEQTTVDSYVHQANSFIKQCRERSINDLIADAESAINAIPVVSKELINSSLESISNNKSVLSITETLQQQYSQAWATIEIGRVLLQKRVNIFECRQFMTKNPEIIAKLMPFGCTTLYHLLNNVLLASNAPEKILTSLDNIAEYGQENGFILKMTANKDSQRIIIEKQKLITQLLINLEYDVFQALLYSLINENIALQKMFPAKLDYKTLITLIDQTLYNILSKTFTSAELKALVAFSTSKAAQQLKRPDVYNELIAVSLKPLLNGPIGAALTLVATSTESPVQSMAASLLSQSATSNQ